MYNNSNFLNSYNPYNLGNATGINSSYQSQHQEIIKVNGREGANAYPLNAPNSSVMMLDINQPILYVKISDGAGYCNITTYTISPLEVSNNININTADLEKRIARLEDIVNESHSISIENIGQQKSTQSNSKH